MQRALPHAAPRAPAAGGGGLGGPSGKGGDLGRQKRMGVGRVRLHLFTLRHPHPPVGSGGLRGHGSQGGPWMPNWEGERGNTWSHSPESCPVLGRGTAVVHS